MRPDRLTPWTLVANAGEEAKSDDVLPHPARATARGGEARRLGGDRAPGHREPRAAVMERLIRESIR
jgi:hypothetical protein